MSHSNNQHATMRHPVLLSGLLALLLADSPIHAQTYIQPPEVSAVDQNGIDLLSGSATLTIKRGSIGSGIGELSFSDYWVSSLTSNSLNNISYFTLNSRTGAYSASVGFQNSSKSFKQIAGSTDWLAINYVDGTLTQSADGNTLYLTMKDGEVRTYGLPPGQTTFSNLVLLSRVQPNGVKWIYNWQAVNGYARPLSVTNNLGYQISLTYQSNTPPSLSDPANVVYWDFVSGVSFYNLAQAMAPIVSATGSVASGGQGGLEQIVTAGGQVWKVNGLTATDSFQPVSTTPFTVKTPSSSTFNFSYKPVAPQPINSTYSTSAIVNGLQYNYTFILNNITSGDTIVTDPLGEITEVKYTNYRSTFASSAFVNSVKDGVGNLTSYAGSGYIITNVTRPGLDQDVYAYDLRNNITSVTHIPKPGSTTPTSPIVESAVFPTTCSNVITCNKPTSTTDANGKTTQYTYDPTHGGVLTETLPAVNTPTANTINPVKRYSYVQRSAWILNGAGGYVKASSPVWLKNDERTCRTSATVGNACSGGSADETVTTYQYGPDSGPNNLLLRGVMVSSNGQSLLTCYAYDAQGNKISETKPLGTSGAGGTCP